MTDIWTGWSYLGGYVTNLEVGTNADGRLEVFGIGSDNIVYRNWQTTPNGDWSGWFSLEGDVPAITDIDVATNQDGRLEVFAIGSECCVSYLATRTEYRLERLVRLRWLG